MEQIRFWFKGMNGPILLDVESAMAPMEAFPHERSLEALGYRCFFPSDPINPKGLEDAT